MKMHKNFLDEDVGGDTRHKGGVDYRHFVTFLIEVGFLVGEGSDIVH